MSRTANKKSPPAEAPEILPAVAARIEAAQDMALSTAETDEVFAAGLDVGRLEALDFVGTVTIAAIVSVYENVKKSKAWRLLRNPKSGHGAHFESLEEFCEVKLGKSYERIRKIAANRALIGQDAFEQAERIGLRQVDYNAIKALPAPDQELVRRAVEESKSRDEVIDLLQELAVRHAQTRSERDEALADKQATEQVLADKNKRIDQLRAAQKRINAEPPDERSAAIQAEAASMAADLQGRLQGMLRQAFIAVINSDDERDRHSIFLAGLLGQLQARVTELRDEFDLPDLSTAADDEPGIDMAALAVLEARNLAQARR